MVSLSVGTKLQEAKTNLQNDAVLQPGQIIKPQLNEDDVQRLMLKLYGMKVKGIKEFRGYDDRNYFVEVEEIHNNQHVEQLSTDGYVLKIVNSLDSKKPELVDAQTQLMLFMQNQGFVVPSPVKNVHGHFISLESLGKNDGNGHIVRLLSFLPGDILYNVKCTHSMCFQTGHLAAKFDTAAQGFHHPIYEKSESIWMLSKAPNVKQFLDAVDDGDKRQLVLTVLEEFEMSVLKNIKALPKGIIHGDLNEQNLIVREACRSRGCKGHEVYAIIDFGDANFSCVVFEIVLVATYIMLLVSDVRESPAMGGHAVAGYISERKLSPLEWDILKISIEARLCQSLVMGAYSYKQDPSNTYVLITAKNGWNLLNLLRSIEKEALYETWKSILKGYNL